MKTVRGPVVLGAVVAALGGCGSSLKDDAGTGAVTGAAGSGLAGAAGAGGSINTGAGGSVNTGAAGAGVIGGAGGSVGTVAPDSVVEACVQLQEAMTSWWTRCVGGSDADWRDYIRSWQDCAATADHLLAGRVVYHPERFPTCLAELQEPCDQGPDDFCPFAVIDGRVPDGQHCQETQVCALTSTCFQAGTETCGEVCMRFGAENETCGLYCGGSSRCFDGPYCDGDLACVSDVCVKTKGVGAACGLADPVPCSALLHCTAHPVDAQSTGTCQPAVSGGACYLDPDCPAHDFCLQGVCTARRLQGQPCSDAPSGCTAWTTCDARTGTCVRAGKPGLPCLVYPGTDYRYCQIGVCTPGNVCVASAIPGESCQTTTCAIGSSCDFSSRTCVACPP